MFHVQEEIYAYVYPQAVSFLLHGASSRLCFCLGCVTHKPTNFANSLDAWQSTASPLHRRKETKNLRHITTKMETAPLIHHAIYPVQSEIYVQVISTDSHHLVEAKCDAAFVAPYVLVTRFAD